MKKIISWICFELGDLLSRLMFRFPIFNFLYPVYNRLIYWSVTIGEKNEAK
jgi:hypothetical protein